MAEGAACCDFNSDRGHPYHTTPPYTYVDVFGFGYRLCARHYQALVTGLQKAERFRPVGAQARRAYRPLAPRSVRVPGDAVATGEEQRRARTRVGWTLRRMQDELGRGRAQVQAAECGRRPVDPEVARWVRRVLDGVDTGTEEATGDAPARR
jgi:hypothetical protein